MTEDELKESDISRSRRANIMSSGWYRRVLQMMERWAIIPPSVLGALQRMMCRCDDGSKALCTSSSHPKPYIAISTSSTSYIFPWIPADKKLDMEMQVVRNAGIGYWMSAPISYLI